MWNGKTNGYSIAALTLSLFGCVGVVSIVLGIIGLRRSIRNGDRRGRFYAIASFVVCAVWAGLLGGLIVKNAEWGPDRDASGTVVGERSLRTEDLRAGDCLKDLWHDATSVGDHMDVVPCSVEHSSELVAVVELPDGKWLGDEKMSKTADGICAGKYHEYTRSKAEPEEFVMLALGPDQQAWPSDRHVYCIADHTGGKATGSLKG